MIPDSIYESYLRLLLQGRSFDCKRIVQDLLEQQVQTKTLYADLFQKSLYAVGDQWEASRISVAKEHLATAITEGLLSLVYARLFDKEPSHRHRRAVISCAANEYHQIGGKMVADLFELHGWHGHFLGANTPVEHMLAYIQEIKPDVVGLSLSIYFNLGSLKASLEAIRSDFKQIDILVGGQAFRWGGVDTIRTYTGTEYVPNLDALERIIGA